MTGAWESRETFARAKTASICAGAKLSWYIPAALLATSFRPRFQTQLRPLPALTGSWANLQPTKLPSFVQGLCLLAPMQCGVRSEDLRSLLRSNR